LGVFYDLGVKNFGKARDLAKHFIFYQKSITNDT